MGADWIGSGRWQGVDTLNGSSPGMDRAVLRLRKRLRLDRLSDSDELVLNSAVSVGLFQYQRSQYLDQHCQRGAPGRSGNGLEIILDLGMMKSSCVIFPKEKW